MNTLFRNYSGWAVAVVVVVALPLVFSSGFSLSIMGQTGVALIFALAYNMLLGQGGMLSFGHAIFFGLAGYSTIHVMKLIEGGAAAFFPVALLPLVGGVAGLVFGIVIGFVSTRRAGTTFAMISLGFGEMVTALTLIFVSFFNGEEGIQGDRMVGPRTFGVSFGPNIEVYYLIAAWALLAVLGMYLLTGTPFGRMCNAVRDNPERAQFIGYNTQRVRWLAFSLSAFFSGVAGALHAINFEHVGFETVGAEHSGYVLFMVFIGGVGHFLGPVLGALLVTFLRGTLGEVTEAWPLYLGAFFILMVMYAPGGLAGIVMFHEPIWKANVRLLKILLLPYLAAIGSILVTAVGVIGLVEAAYFLSHHMAGETRMTLFWVPAELHGVTPWAILLAFTAAGYFLCARAFPQVAQSRALALEEAKKAVAV